MALGLALLAALVAATPAGDETKAKPVKAPDLLDNVEWLKGRTYKRFQRGNVYVLDFFMPWSGLSRDALPYLKSIRQKYAAQERLVFISIATVPLGSALTAEMFLDKRGDLFDNIVVRDILSKAWASYQQVGHGTALPGVVIINKVGNIAWSGSPFEDVAAPLDAVLADDEARLAELLKARKAQVKKMKATVESYNHAYQITMWAKALGEADKLLAADARLYVTVPRFRYELLLRLGKKEEAATYGRSLVEGVYADMEFELDMLAWLIVEGDLDLPKETRDLDLALLAAEKARTLSAGKDWSILDTLARVHFSRGEVDRAIAIQTDSVAQATSGEERERAKSILKAYSEKQAPPAAERPIK